MRMIERLWRWYYRRTLAVTERWAKVRGMPGQP